MDVLEYETERMCGQEKMQWELSVSIQGNGKRNTDLVRIKE